MGIIMGRKVLFAVNNSGADFVCFVFLIGQICTRIRRTKKSLEIDDIALNC